jgi:hypothetical protein
MKIVMNLILNWQVIIPTMSMKRIIALPFVPAPVADAVGL